jgi:hypothetical protein
MTGQWGVLNRILANGVSEIEGLANGVSEIEGLANGVSEIE